MSSVRSLSPTFSYWLNELFTPSQWDAATCKVVLRYDEWSQDCAALVAGRSTVLPVEFRFGPGSSKSLTLRAHGHLRLTCTAGAVWVTTGQDTRDHVLAAGQSMQVKNPRSVVVFSMQHGLLHVAPVTTV